MIRFTPVLVLLLAALATGAEEPKTVVYRSKEGKFSVTLPDKPAEKTNKVKTDAGEVDAHMVELALPDRAFVITYSDYPKGAVTDVEKQLSAVVAAHVKTSKGKLASEEKITIGKKKYPGRDIRIELPEKKGLYRARLFLVGDRLYQVVALGPDEFTKGKAVDDYLNSFAIDE